MSEDPIRDESAGRGEPENAQAKNGQSDPEPGPESGLELARQIAAAAQLRGQTGPTAPQKPKKKRAQHRDYRRYSNDRDPKPLGDAMDGLLRRKGWRTQINVQLLIGKWSSLVGEVNADHSEPVGYSDKVLTVRADSSTWAASLRMIAPQIVAQINRELGDGTVTRVDVRGPQAPSWQHGRRSVRGRGPRDTYG
ncbi:DciA family protein [Parenemella sanctibonifatiensis]|uniref:DUF721 domain-containing protein n=1 Tax=Parenemella sanctibonifatiensis TaxID=2016505 RepID=UPI001E37B526|nr:DciA family protein [Parenemella sanctibonifatiensis]